jgi:predicted transcriptional regulator
MHETATELRRITLRVSPQLHQNLTQVAQEQNKSLNHLAVEALEEYLLQTQERLPLQEMSDLLVPAAQAAGLDEESLLRHVKEARRRIWQERYQQMAENT